MSNNTKDCPFLKTSNDFQQCAAHSRAQGYKELKELAVKKGMPFPEMGKSLHAQLSEIIEEGCKAIYQKKAKYENEN